jgi:hypothetical protein
MLTAGGLLLLSLLAMKTQHVHDWILKVVWLLVDHGSMRRVCIGTDELSSSGVTCCLTFLGAHMRVHFVRLINAYFPSLA